MKITATSEKACNEILRQSTYSGSYWAAIRLVGWIAQNKNDRTTTLYFKWQVGADNYWPYWNVTLPFTVTLEKSSTIAISIPQATNSWVDISPVESIKVAHDNSGSYSGTLHASGYKYWEAFAQDVAITFPDISASSSETETQAETENATAPVTSDVFDNRFYILSDGEIVYSPNDTQHIVTNPQLSISVNETDSLSFTMPPSNEMYSKIDKLRSTIEVRQGTDILFRGRVIDDSTDFNNLKSVNCEGAKAFFSDTVMPPFLKGTYKTAKTYFKAIVDQHNSQAKTSRELQFVKCNIAKDIEVESDEYQSCADALSQLLDAVGDGYFKLEYYQDGTTGISYISSFGHTSSQQIEFGKNLLDVTVKVDATSIYTSVLPLGAKKETYFVTSDSKKNPDKTYYVQKEEKHQDYDDPDKPGHNKTRTAYEQFNEDQFVAGTTYYEQGLSYRLRIASGGSGYVEDQSAIEKFGRIVRVFTFDDIVDSDPDTWDAVNYADQLRQVGGVYLQAGLGADVTLEGKLVDFHIINSEEEKLHVGDSVKIISTPHSLDGYYMLSSCDLQLQNPDQSSYTFGASIRALTSK